MEKNLIEKDLANQITNQKKDKPEEEKQIQEFVNYEDDLPSINEGEIELISADLISGNLDSGFEQTQILEKTVEIPENYEKRKREFSILFNCIFYYFDFIIFCYQKKEDLNLVDLQKK